jgi:hypothetical protein
MTHGLDVTRTNVSNPDSCIYEPSVARHQHVLNRKNFSTATGYSRTIIDTKLTRRYLAFGQNEFTSSLIACRQLYRIA